MECVLEGDCRADATKLPHLPDLLDTPRAAFCQVPASWNRAQRRGVVSWVREQWGLRTAEIQPLQHRKSAAECELPHIRTLCSETHLASAPHVPLPSPTSTDPARYLLLSPIFRFADSLASPPPSPPHRHHLLRAGMGRRWRHRRPRHRRYHIKVVEDSVPMLSNTWNADAVTLLVDQSPPP